MKSIYKNIHINLLLLILVLGVQGLHAQTDIVLNDVVVGKTDVSASNSITLNPGFKAKAGSSFHAYISADATNNPTNPTLESTSDVNVNGTPTTGENYVRTVNFPDLPDNRMEQVAYFDGLGRPVQTVSVNASPQGHDIVQHVYYDDLGRESRKYLPYVTNEGTAGSLRNDAETATKSFYQGTIQGKNKSDAIPYSETVFENSPLNRVLSTVGAGSDWHSKNKSVKYDYQTNTSSINSWDEYGNTKTYESSTLYVNQVTDENGNITREYKDLLGQLILKESVTNTEILKTHYIYDDYGLLRIVVPPLADSPAEADEELCYFYQYDGRKRMISKKIPGADWVYMVYDKRDRLVLVQDGNLRDESTTGANKYRFTQYDGFNRPVMTGELVTSNSLETIRTLFQEDDNYVPYEEYTGSGAYGYTSQSYPTGIIITSKEIETVTWYDNYKFITDLDDVLANEFAYSAPSGFESAETDDATGLATGSMVKAFGVSGSGYNMARDEMYSVSYYDDDANVIQTIAQNHLSGRDVVSSRYQDVTHRLEETQQVHKLGAEEITIIENYDYDHAGRLLETTHQVNDQDPVILNAMRYNELGELVEKYLHAKEGSNAFVQKVDFLYNIRGWLTQINNPVLEDNDLFGMKLYYTDASNITGVTADDQFNGNIAAMQWNTANDKLRGYGFQYDALNRLTNANYGEGTSLSTNQGFFSMSADYDKNGNIDWLKRNYNGSLADDLTYKYIGNNTNKLEYVLDGAGDNPDINDYPITGDASSKYEYDLNGNMTEDPSLNSTIKYNSMNLPEHIDEISGTNKVDIFYHYDATGRKLAKTNESGNASVDNTTDYVGNMVYENNEIAYIQTSEGRMIPIKDENGTRWHYEYALKDHLGNTRVTFGGSLLGGSVDIIQQSHYYPFGLVFKQENYQNNLTDYTENKYLYNGKELQGDKFASGRSLNWYDYGARMYDPALGRWHVMDKMSELFPYSTPYVYALNNPLKYIDPDGNIPWDAIIAGRTYGARTGNNAFSQARKNPVDGVTRPHTGIDLGYHPAHGKLKGGETIRSAARGRVIKVGHNSVAGNYVVVDHGDGYQTVYCHIQNEGVLVKEKETVKDGQAIAKVGTTGRSTGNHLHFGMKKDGEWMDPTSIKDLDAFLHGDEGKLLLEINVLENEVTDAKGDALDVLNDRDSYETQEEWDKAVDDAIKKVNDLNDQLQEKKDKYQSSY